VLTTTQRLSSRQIRTFFFFGSHQLSKTNGVDYLFFSPQVLTTVNGCREALEQVQEEDQMALMYLTALKVLFYLSFILCCIEPAFKVLLYRDAALKVLL
jgi:hypothetical protein